MLVRALLLLTACSDPTSLAVAKTLPPPSVSASAPQSIEVVAESDDVDCNSLDDEVERAFCEQEHGPSEQELVLANLRPVGVPADLIDVSDIVAASRSPRRYRGFQFPIPAEAQTDYPTLLLARITASEEGWESFRGMEVIYQIARNVRSRSCDPTRHSDCDGDEESILSALRRLAPRVSGMRRPTRWRQYWTSTLPEVAPEEPPRLWRECEDDRDRDCDGRWDRYRGLWDRLQTHAALLLSSDYPPRVCRGTPLAWGCRDCGDDIVMMRRNANRESRGLRPYVELSCAPGIENRIWGLLPDGEEEAVDEESQPLAVDEDRRRGAPCTSGTGSDDAQRGAHPCS